MRQGADRTQRQGARTGTGQRVTEIASKPRPRLAPPTPPSVEPGWSPRLTAPSGGFVRRWLALLAGVVAALALLGLALPLLAPVDRAVFDAVNALGYGPDAVFELLDPHERLYRGLLLLAMTVAFVLRGPWVALGVAVALMSAATASYVLLEAIALLSDRPRPQAVFANILKPAGADWAQASYPSGHVAVATAMAAASALALPVLRWPMVLVALVIAWSRIAFGAHFPLDVLAGAVLGYAAAASSVALAIGLGLLPRPPEATREDPQVAR